MTELNKTEELLKSVHDGVVAVQDIVDAQGKKLDAIDMDKIEKAAQATADGLQKLQDEKSAEKFTELEAKLADVEKSTIALQRSGADGSSDEYKHELAAYLRKEKYPDEDAVMDNIKEYLVKNTYGVSENEIDMLAKDMAAGSNPAGGFFITSDRSSQMIKRIFETSPLRGVANMLTTSSDIVEMIIDDNEADCDWVGEVSSRPTTDTPDIGRLNIPVHEIFAKPKLTQKILDDAGFDIEGWIADKVSMRIGRKENTAFVVGDGSQKPRGFLSLPAWASAGAYERGKVEQINSGSAGSFDADAVIGLQNALLEDYQANATFGMKRATFTDVMQLKDGNGRYLLNPQILAEGSTKVLLGNDVIFMNDMPGVAADALALVIADFKEFYTIVERFGIRVLRDPFSAKPFVEFYTTKRTGGDVTNYEAGKILKLSA